MQAPEAWANEAMEGQLREQNGVRIAVEGCVSPTNSAITTLFDAVTDTSHTGPWDAQCHLLIGRKVMY